MKRSGTVTLMMLVLATMATSPVRAADEVHGKAVFNLWCVMCHARVAPGGAPIAGTSSLERLYKGLKPAALEDRTDLTAAYIKALVRKGRKSMPPSRKTEISDADIDDLAAYLMRSR